MTNIFPHSQCILLHYLGKKKGKGTYSSLWRNSWQSYGAQKWHATNIL